MGRIALNVFLWRLSFHEKRKLPGRPQDARKLGFGKSLDRRQAGKKPCFC
jgi:hypothetical protein